METPPRARPRYAEPPARCCPARCSRAGGAFCEARFGKGRRRALDRVPAHVVGARLLVGSAAPTQAEQALGEQQPDRDGQVDQEADDLERRLAVGDLVDLEWE